MLKRTVTLRRFFEYPQHMFWMRNKENSFPICTLIWSPGMLWWSILQYFPPSLSYHLSSKPMFCLLWVAAYDRFYWIQSIEQETCHRRATHTYHAGNSCAFLFHKRFSERHWFVHILLEAFIQYTTPETSFISMDQVVFIFTTIWPWTLHRITGSAIFARHFHHRFPLNVLPCGSAQGWDRTWKSATNTIFFKHGIQF